MLSASRLRLNTILPCRIFESLLEIEPDDVRMRRALTTTVSCEQGAPCKVFTLFLFCGKEHIPCLFHSIIEVMHPSPNQNTVYLCA